MPLISWPGGFNANIAHNYVFWYKYSLQVQ